MWRRIVESTFPGSYEEYKKAREIHREEVKTYRVRWQFILGIVVFFSCFFHMLIWGDWVLRILAVLLLSGEMLIGDSISEHYSWRLLKLVEQDGQQDACAPNSKSVE